MKPLYAVAAALAFAPLAAAAQTGDAPVAINAHYTLDTPIKVLVADSAAKAVLDKDLPGMSADENLPKFEDKSLRELQPMTGGQLTDDMLKQVGEDLATIGSEDAALSPSISDDEPPADDTPAPAPSGDTGR